jgi:hypothetical protein
MKQLQQMMYLYCILSSGKSRKKSSNSKDNAVRPQYMESSTESEDEDDRKIDSSSVNIEFYSTFI